LPVPAPATLGLLKGWRCHAAGPARELTTPTGAALVTTLGRQVDALPEMRVELAGCGAGGSDPPGWPNVLRLIVGEVAFLPEGLGAELLAGEADLGHGVGPRAGFVSESWGSAQAAE
jgi:uncharacterized protein (DUF111 family)